MLSKLKSLFKKSEPHNLLDETNEEEAIKAFLLGSKLEVIKFNSYYFVKNNSEVSTILELRDFKSASDYADLKLDLLSSFGESVYNAEHQFLFTLIDELKWDTLSVAIHIAEKSTDDYEIQYNIILNIMDSELKW